MKEAQEKVDVVAQTTMRWQKSSFCADGACIEVAFDGDDVAIRDGKNRSADALRFTRDEWKAFVRGIKADEFSPSS
jgi:hypothetical protein